MNAWLTLTTIHLKLTLRDRQALFWNYLFPLFFLFVFLSIFGRGGPRSTGIMTAGLLCISTMAVGFFGLNIGLVTARERNILRRYRLAPIHPWLILSSEVATNFLTALSSLIIQLMLAKTVYRLKIAGSLWALLVMLSVGVLAFLALGLIIASVAENTKVAPVMANLLFFPLMFLGGAAIPLEMLPPLMQKISRWLPSTYLVDGLRRIIVDGVGLSANLGNLIVLGLTFGVALIIATQLFRWEPAEPLPWSKKALATTVILVFALAALWRGGEISAERSPVLVIRGGRVIDGTGRAPIDNAVVIIEGEKIKAVLGEREATIPDGARAIAARGKTILPGLIDVHVHLGGSAGAATSPEEYTPARELHDLKAYLFSGVTTIKSLGDMEERILDLRAREWAGDLLAPRLFAVGKVFTAPGGHPVSTIFAGAPDFVVDAAVFQVKTEEQARAGVRALAADGVDGIKAIYDGGTPERPLPKLDRSLLAAIIDEAHKTGLRVSVHCGTGQDVREAVLAGADGIEHADQEDLDDETIALMAERGVFYSPTLAVFEALLNLAKGLRPADDPLVRACVLPTILTGLTASSSPMLRRLREHPRAVIQLEHRLQAAKMNVRRARAAGVKIVTGTDAGNPGTFHGPALHRELALLVEAGLTPLETIIAATRQAADYLGAGDRLGTIEPGKLADIVILDGDPLKDISATERIWKVIRGGRVIDRQRLFAEHAVAEASPTAPPSGPLVEDFEDGDTISRWGGRWTAVDDRVAGGSSHAQIDIVPAGAHGSRHALKISGRVTTRFTWGPFAGAALSLSRDPQSTVDVSAYRGIQFYVRGDGKTYRMLVHIAAVKDYDAFFASFTAGNEWRLVRIPFSELRQQGFGRRVEWNARQVKSIAFFTSGAPHEAFELYLDDIAFYK